MMNCGHETSFHHDPREADGKDSVDPFFDHVLKGVKAFPFSSFIPSGRAVSILA
jgi:hypothetical protein